MTVLAAAGVAAFALAAGTGAHAGAMMCSRQVAFADGPRPIAPSAWTFAAGGALLGAIAAPHATGAPAMATCALLVGILAAGAAADLRCGILPDRCTLAPLALILAADIIRGGAPAGLAAGAALALPFALSAMLSRGRGMGWGDVKLAALGGAMLGVPAALLAAFCALAVAVVAALAGRRTHEPMAFGPYLAGAVAVALAINPSFLVE